MDNICGSTLYGMRPREYTVKEEKVKDKEGFNALRKEFLIKLESLQDDVIKMYDIHATSDLYNIEILLQGVKDSLSKVEQLN